MSKYISTGAVTADFLRAAQIKAGFMPSSAGGGLNLKFLVLLVGAAGAAYYVWKKRKA